MDFERFSGRDARRQGCFIGSGAHFSRPNPATPDRRLQRRGRRQLAGLLRRKFLEDRFFDFACGESDLFSQAQSPSYGAKGRPRFMEGEGRGARGGVTSWRWSEVTQPRR